MSQQEFIFGNNSAEILKPIAAGFPGHRIRPTAYNQLTFYDLLSILNSVQIWECTGHCRVGWVSTLGWLLQRGV